MTEKEYRFWRFDALISRISDKRIVLYGTGVNAKEIIENYPQLQIVGIIEKKRSTPYIYGKRNLRLEELISLKVDVVVIASTIAPIKEIYNRICAFCHANRIDIYDMYGDDLSELFYKLVENQRTICERTEETLFEWIKNYDIISVDLFESLFNHKRIIEEIIWWQVAEENKEICAQNVEFIKARKMAEERAKENGKSNDLEVIYLNLQEILGIASEQTQELMRSEKDIYAKKLGLDKSLLNILKYAKECGKKVVLISETYFSENEIKNMLANIEISDYDVILSSADRKCTKLTGLFRAIEKGDQNWLHIGENEIADGVCPLIYGMDIFLLESPQNLSEDSQYKEILKSIMQWCAQGKLAEMVKYGGSDLLESIIRTELVNHFAFCGEKDEKHFKLRMNSLKKLSFHSYASPEVSIIIPVYNQFLFTYNCLLSILKNTDGISYEIIIADDCSQDFTAHIEGLVEGVTVIRNKTNLKFLKNCNNAAQKARGEYILFLNNDTYVQPRWLLRLLSLIKSRPDIGMVGSKLIYPDGLLQEAGGIVWNDASAWNFGHEQNAGAPVFNFMRETDYVSGAAAMIRKKLWDEIGGFDEAFAPAYYEDTDLAFEVRKRGYKVAFQPFSIVVHYEGISNGKDINVGLKAYQLVNKEKFYTKWETELRRVHYKNGSNFFLARDRSRFKKHILVVDHYVPRHDQDAGGRCTYMYLKAFLKMGMSVSFIGDNFAYSVPYSQELLEMGVEILYGSYNKLHIQSWLEDNLKYFDYVYLQRPHISIKYIDMIREMSNAKVFYFAHDLHHIRLKRQYELTHDESVLQESKKWEKIELELFNKADVGHVVGDFEQGYMQRIYPDKPIRNIPLYIFEGIHDHPGLAFEERKDIMYVGGFGHPPNIDAVLWFATEVFPEILKKYPKMKWHVIGSNPPDEVLKLASENIIIHGYVNDEKLKCFYQECRLAVVPLRVGAGVKGKVIEAAYFQVPVITTDVGAEGISKVENAMIIENTAVEMADRICQVYGDIDELNRLAENERNLIKKHYLLKNAIDALQQDL